MLYLTDRITIDEGLCNGKPTIRRRRVTVQTILAFLKAGDNRADILYQYPMLKEEDMEACIKFDREKFDCVSL